MLILYILFKDLKIEIHCFPDNFIGQKIQYSWTKDEVQTARMLFYVRVIPTCIERVPTQVYGKVVAPTMFLYPVLRRANSSLFLFFLASSSFFLVSCLLSYYQVNKIYGTSKCKSSPSFTLGVYSFHVREG